MTSRLHDTSTGGIRYVFVPARSASFEVAQFAIRGTIYQPKAKPLGTAASPTNRPGKGPLGSEIYGSSDKFVLGLVDRVNA